MSVGFSLMRAIRLLTGMPISCFAGLRPACLCAFIVLAAIPVGGCDQNQRPVFTKEEIAKIPNHRPRDLPAPSGGFALAVGDETIAAEEFVRPFVPQMSRMAASMDFASFRNKVYQDLQQELENHISRIILYRQAKDRIGDIDEALDRAVEVEVRNFIAGFGSDYSRAEEHLRRNNMDWNSFKEKMRREIFVNSYLASRMPAEQTITYGEMLQYYNEHKGRLFSKAGSVTLRVIDIQPAKLRDTGGLDRAEAADRLAAELLARLEAGEDFDGLARLHSHGHRAEYGGLWDPRSPESIAEPYDAIFRAVETLPVGGITGPVKTGEHIFIVRLENAVPAQVTPFDDVQRQIEQAIRIQRRRDALQRLEVEIADQAVLVATDQFLDFCVKLLYEARG